MKANDKNALAGQWPEAKQFRRSIRIEFSLYISGIILALMLATGYIMTDRYVKTVTQDVIEKLLVQTRSYSGSAGKLIISTNGPDALLLNNICNKLASDNSDVYWVGITDRDDNFLAHTDIKQVISGGTMAPIQKNDFDEILLAGEFFEQRNDTIYIASQIKESGVAVGRLGIAASTAQIKSARNASIVTVASTTILMILLGIPLTMVLLHRKLKPISIITDTLKGVQFDNIAIDIPLRSRNEFGYLAETLHVMGGKLNAARRDMVERERINREFEIAREIQANILPGSYPRHGNYDFCGSYQSARQVGGDYYDFIDFDERHLAFLVADVSGKSLPGMLVMLLTRDIVKTLSWQSRQPDELLCEVNRELLPSIRKGMFVTMFYGLLDKQTGLFKFASAGHNPLIKIEGRTGRTELIKTRGFPLGMVPPEQFNNRIECTEVQLSADDWLVQFTDGINEAVNQDGEEFGMERFVERLETARTESPPELIKQVIAEHELFTGQAEQFDDITLLAMKWTGKTYDKDINEKNGMSHAGQFKN